MYAVLFTEVAFAQSAKYVLIVKNSIETKRSEVCSLWTSVPNFPQPVLIDSLDNLTIKACSATIDRKLTVIGSFSIPESETSLESQIIHEETHSFTQKIEEKEVCVGNCKIKITRFRPISHGNGDGKGEEMGIDEEFQLRSQGESSEGDGEEKETCELKFVIHGGFDFYLGSGFKVCINWGSKKAQTKLINDRIAPFWGRTLNLKGQQSKTLEISIHDKSSNKLQWLKLDPKQIRIMYPYHLHIKFREEYLGMHPHFFLTIIRQDVPLFSILDKKIDMKIRYVGPAGPVRFQQYLLIYPRELEGNLGDRGRLPIFVELDMKNYISFQTVNKLIEKSPDRKYEWANWNLLIPVNVHPDETAKQFISLLKSFLTKSLVCLYFTLEDPKSLFCNQIWNSVNILDRKQNFQNSVKELYYTEKRIVLGKAVELSNNDVDGLENEKAAVSLEERWKILTHNYGLRKRMLTKSVDTTEEIKKQIKEKGEYLEHLKKVLIQVKKMNQIMLQKQKSSLIETTKSQKISLNPQKISTIEIVTTLLQKQVQLQKRKKINDQMRMRMDSLHYFNQDSEQLDKILVENAEKLLEQQAKIKQLKKEQYTDTCQPTTKTPRHRPQNNHPNTYRSPPTYTNSRSNTSRLPKHIQSQSKIQKIAFYDSKKPDRTREQSVFGGCWAGLYICFVVCAGCPRLGPVCVGGLVVGQCCSWCCFVYYIRVEQRVSVKEDEGGCTEAARGYSETGEDVRTEGDRQIDELAIAEITGQAELDEESSEQEPGKGIHNSERPQKCPTLASLKHQSSRSLADPSKFPIRKAVRPVIFSFLNKYNKINREMH